MVFDYQGREAKIIDCKSNFKKSKIILLDEATSSLDSDTEEKFRCNKLFNQRRTTLVIAHRLSTILNSNKIYVIDKGKVIGEGKHEELGKVQMFIKISMKSKFKKLMRIIYSFWYI